MLDPSAFETPIETQRNPLAALDSQELSTRPKWIHATNLFLFLKDLNWPLGYWLQPGLFPSEPFHFTAVSFGSVIGNHRFSIGT